MSKTSKSLRASGSPRETPRSDGKPALTPKLRFPEFQNAGEWEVDPFEKLIEVIDGDRGVNYPKAEEYSQSGYCLFLSATNVTKTGFKLDEMQFVSKEKDEALRKGKLKRADVVLTTRGTVGQFAYYSEQIPYENIRINSGMVILRIKTKTIVSDYFYSFTGSEVLSSYIKNTAFGNAQQQLTVGEIIKFQLYYPSPPEQQKIADCLSSMDELIAAQTRKLDALNIHKKGLMQQLFPREGETQPRFRFPEFRDAPEWVEAPLGDLFVTMTGGTPDRAKKQYWYGTIPWVTTSLVDFNIITSSEEFISEDGLENSSAKMFPKGTVLVALYGQGKTRGKVALLGIEATTNQACAAILPGSNIDPLFTFANLSGRYEEMRAMSNAGGQENLSQCLIRELPFRYPKDSEEQAKIIGCLTSLDDLIAAQTQKLDALKTHKKGLMQQLFPSPEED